MDKFTKHFRMAAADAAAYAAQKLTIFAKGARLHCTELSDGNINYVFRVEDEEGNSVIIKHADLQIRTSGGSLDTDRNRIEAEVLRLQGRLAPGLVPEVYLYDPVMCCIVMQDMRGYQNLRYALCAHRQFPALAGHLAGFMAGTLMRSSDLVLPPAEKKALVAAYINPGLCDITERLVYTDPYTDHGGVNILYEPNREFLQRELYGDNALRLEAAKLKLSFESKPQALIHGDLHTGSVFVTEENTCVLDPEFAFFGPMGYDVGNVVANLGFAWANAAVTLTGTARAAQLAWLEGTITQVVDLFYEKSLAILAEETWDVMYQTPGFAGWYLQDVLADAAGVAGLELNRRIIGTAKVADITGIEDLAARVLAERTCVLAAKRFITGRGGYSRGAAFAATLRESYEHALAL